MQTNMDWPRSALGLTLGSHALSHIAMPWSWALGSGRLLCGRGLFLPPWLAGLAVPLGWLGVAWFGRSRSRSAGGLGLLGLGDDLSYSMLQYKEEISFEYSWP